MYINQINKKCVRSMSGKTTKFCRKIYQSRQLNFVKNISVKTIKFCQKIYQSRYLNFLKIHSSRQLHLVKKYVSQDN